MSAVRSLPRFALAAAGLLILACRGSATPEPKAETAPAEIVLETVLQRSIPGQGGGEIREVARDQASWKALWDRLREGSGVLPADPPAVDFTQEMVIAAAMPTQSCVSKVTVRGVRRSGGELIVDLLEAPPAPNCTCIVAERPIHVVRLPRSAEPVRFEAERGVTACG